MAFKIIERFQAVVALIAGFAEGRAEAADLFGVFGAASWAFFRDIQMILVVSFFGWRNSIISEFLAGFISDPIRSPNRRDFGDYFCGNSFFFE